MKKEQIQLLILIKIKKNNLVFNINIYFTMNNKSMT